MKNKAASTEWEVFNVERTNQDDPQHDVGWTFDLDGMRFNPIKGDWTEGWANLTFAKKRPRPRTPARAISRLTPMSDTGKNKDLCKDALDHDRKLDVEEYDGELWLRHERQGAPWKKHVVKLQVVRLSSTASRVVLEFDHQGPIHSSHTKPSVLHGSCTHGDN